MAVLEAKHGDEGHKALLGVLRWVVIISARKASVTEAPPLLLQRLPYSRLRVFYDINERLSWSLTCLGCHHLQLLDLLHSLSVLFLLFFHRLEKLPLLIMFFDLLPRFFETWKDLLFLLKAKAYGFAFGERYLHRSNFSVFWNEHALLVQVGYGLLRTGYRRHPDECATDIAFRLTINNEDFQDLAELFKAISQHFLRHTTWQSAYEQLDPALLTFNLWTPVVCVLSIASSPFPAATSVVLVFF